MSSKSNGRWRRMSPVRVILWLCLAFLMIPMAYGVSIGFIDVGGTPPQAQYLVGPILPAPVIDGQCLAPDYLQMDNHRNNEPVWSISPMEVSAMAPLPYARSGPRTNPPGGC